MKSGDELLLELNCWMASQPEPPSLLEIVRTGNLHLFAAYVLKGFRTAAAEAAQEHERVTRIRRAAEKAFRGDTELAEAWLRRRHTGLDNRSPLNAALQSAVDAEEVLRLIRRLRSSVPNP